MRCISYLRAKQVVICKAYKKGLALPVGFLLLVQHTPARTLGGGGQVPWDHLGPGQLCHLTHNMKSEDQCLVIRWRSPAVNFNRPAKRDAVMADLFDVTGRVSRIARRFCLLTHHLSGGFLEAAQGLLMVHCHALLQLCMGLDTHTHKK